MTRKSKPKHYRYQSNFAKVGAKCCWGFSSSSYQGVTAVTPCSYQSWYICWEIFEKSTHKSPNKDQNCLVCLLSEVQVPLVISRAGCSDTGSNLIQMTLIFMRRGTASLAFSMASKQYSLWYYVIILMLYWSGCGLIPWRFITYPLIQRIISENQSHMIVWGTDGFYRFFLLLAAYIITTLANLHSNAS